VVTRDAVIPACERRSRDTGTTSNPLAMAQRRPRRGRERAAGVPWRNGWLTSSPQVPGPIRGAGCSERNTQRRHHASRSIRGATQQVRAARQQSDLIPFSQSEEIRAARQPCGRCDGRLRW